MTILKMSHLLDYYILTFSKINHSEDTNLEIKTHHGFHCNLQISSRMLQAGFNIGYISQAVSYYSCGYISLIV